MIRQVLLGCYLGVRITQVYIIRGWDFVHTLFMHHMPTLKSRDQETPNSWMTLSLNKIGLIFILEVIHNFSCRSVNHTLIGVCITEIVGNYWLFRKDI